MDADRNDPAYAANVMTLAQQTDWVDGEEKTALLDLAEGQWGKMVCDVRAKKQCVVGGVRWAKDVPFGDYTTNVVEVHQMEATDDGGPYYGQFMTDLEINDARRALEIAMWGRHRWLIEISFKTHTADRSWRPSISITRMRMRIC